jgi:hypothetical protein
MGMNKWKMLQRFYRFEMVGTREKLLFNETFFLE